VRTCGGEREREVVEDWYLREDFLGRGGRADLEDADVVQHAVERHSVVHQLLFIFAQRRTTTKSRRRRKLVPLAAAISSSARTVRAQHARHAHETYEWSVWKR
jgi:hypothetical protein